MDESVGMLSVAAVLVFGIWLVDYSGDADPRFGRASGQRASRPPTTPPARSRLATVMVSPLSSSTGTPLTSQSVSSLRSGHLPTATRLVPRYNVAAAVHHQPAPSE